MRVMYIFLDLYLIKRRHSLRIFQLFQMVVQFLEEILIRERAEWRQSIDEVVQVHIVRLWTNYLLQESQGFIDQPDDIFIQTQVGQIDDNEREGRCELSTNTWELWNHTENSLQDLKWKVDNTS